MRWITAGAAAALAASCVTVPLPPAQPSAGRGGGSSGTSAPAMGAPVAGAPGAVQELAALVNAHRRRAGCPELAWMEPVARAAQGHSDDMARRGYFDHRSPEGNGPAERLAAVGVNYRALAENIARHPGTPRDVLAGWLASPGHRQNLERCTYTHHGIAVRGEYWTHLFVTPLPSPSGP